MSTADSIGVAIPPTGSQMRDEYAKALRAFTFGVVRLRGNSVVLGPIELLRYGRPKINERALEWPLEGGILSAHRGGTLRYEVRDGRVEATLAGWTPRLPRLIYNLTQLQVHLLFTRVFLLRLRGREPAPGRRATSTERRNAAAVDIAFCLTLAGVAGRRSLKRTLVVAAVYHAVCWSATGRTLGGLVVRQRVVAVDGSRVTPTQALLRLALLPASWVTGRPVHDELAATDVIGD